MDWSEPWEIEDVARPVTNEELASFELTFLHGRARYFSETDFANLIASVIHDRRDRQNLIIEVERLKRLIDPADR